MRIELRLPPGWATTSVRGVPSLVIPATAPEVIVHAGAIVELPDDLVRWKANRGRVDLPPDTVISADEEVTLATHDGWPVSVIRSVVKTAAGELVEHRILAYYTFLHLVGAVLIRARDHAALALHATHIDDIIRSARPDFSDDSVVALSELWT